MLEGLNTAAAGMAAQQQRIDAVANDLANANTTGYKHVRVGFRDLALRRRRAAPRPRRAHRRRRGAPSTPAARFDQGALQRPTSRSTSRSRATASSASSARRPPALTRDGSLHARRPRPPRHQHRRHRPAGDHDPARHRAGRVTIGADGTVRAGRPRVGRSSSSPSARPAGAQSVGDNAFFATAASGAPPAAPRRHDAHPGLARDVERRRRPTRWSR